jgi:hypothetical protein
VRRTTAKSDGLRQQLLADYRRTLERWRRPDGVYEKEVALESAAPVVVDAADIMCALLHVGLPCGDYTHDGKHGQKRFLLDEFDRLTEYVDE